jgi:hypothetical protein
MDSSSILELRIVKERAPLVDFARQNRAQAHRERAILAVVPRRVQMVKLACQSSNKAATGGRAAG